MPGDESEGRIRIERLEVSNYRSLGDGVTIQCGDLTALVGPNGSGKSNILRLMQKPL
jgi:AAA15 family ATPase/GTPase